MSGLAPSQLWSGPIEDVVHDLLSRSRDPGRSTIVSSVLSARVSLDVAERQEKTTRELVQATHDLVKQTTKLAWATIAVAALTGISALIVAFGGG
jgi:hypothetical protein